jgi:hypothetical protein
VALEISDLHQCFYELRVLALLATSRTSILASSSLRFFDLYQLFSSGMFY